MSSSSRAMRALALASLIAAPSAAQGVRAQLGVAGSVTFPTSFYHVDPNSDGFTPALHGLVLVDLKLPNTPVGLRLDLSSGHNSANDSLKSRLSAAVGAPSDGKTNLLGGTVDVTYNLRRGCEGICSAGSASTGSSSPSPPAASRWTRPQPSSRGTLALDSPMGPA